MTATGLVDLKAIGEVQMFRGGEPWAELIAMTWEQLTPLIVDNGYSADLVTAAIAELTDPARWFPTCALVTASGRRP
jgi:hypothetical protein